MRPNPVPLSTSVERPIELAAPRDHAFAGHGRTPQVLHLVPSGSKGYEAACGTRVPFKSARYPAWPDHADFAVTRLCPRCARAHGLGGHPLAIDELTARLWHALPWTPLRRDELDRVGIQAGFAPASIGQRLRTLQAAGLVALVQNVLGEPALYQRQHAPNPGRS